MFKCVEARYSQKIQKSGRTTAQVIVEKELEIYPALVYNPAQWPGTGQRHIEFCACKECHDAIMQGIFSNLERRVQNESMEIRSGTATENGLEKDNIAWAG